MTGRIRAATIEEVARDPGDWVFVDLGFAVKKKKTCGLLLGDGEPRVVTFSELRSKIAGICRATGAPLNLLIEAPLSVAFGANGNPAGRTIELRANKPRYWYVGPASSVIVAATYLLRTIHDLPPQREVRLVEGLVSFKTSKVRSSHTKDVIEMRELVWTRSAALGRIFGAADLPKDRGDHVQSAFLVSGMDFGVPPVVAIGA